MTFKLSCIFKVYEKLFKYDSHYNGVIAFALSQQEIFPEQQIARLEFALLIDNAVTVHINATTLNILACLTARRGQADFM